MSELEKKRAGEGAAEQSAQRQRAESVEPVVATKPKGENEEDELPPSVAHLMPWDADVDHLTDRLNLFVRDLRASMGHTEFRSLVVAYRELSPMGRRAMANHLQQRRLNALLRALHAGDYSMYQQTWEADVEAHRLTQGGGGKLDSGG